MSGKPGSTVIFRVQATFFSSQIIQESESFTVTLPFVTMRNVYKASGKQQPR